MPKKNIAEIKVTSKSVLMRVDFNVPQNESSSISDDRRIQMALPTIQNVLDRGGRLILMSHLGRPKGDTPKVDMRWTLAPVASRLENLLNRPVIFSPHCIGAEAEKIASSLKNGECCLLENLRFHSAEQIKDKDAAQDPRLREQKDAFARKLAGLADIYVNDAFGTCHRDNASMLTVPQQMGGKPKVSGFLLQKELKYLGDALSHPQRPFVAIIGGKKVSDKIGVIEALFKKCDAILIGGAMYHTFMLAQERGIGASFAQEEKVDEARRLINLGGEKLKLPIDLMAAPKLEENIQPEVMEGEIPPGMMGLDIGPKTIALFSQMITRAKTIAWNGPMGVFEVKPFHTGTFAVARALVSATEAGAISIIGGGDSAAAIDEAGLSDQVSHISTGGGASLEFMEGKSFQAVEVLDNT